MVHEACRNLRSVKEIHVDVGGGGGEREIYPENKVGIESLSL